MQVDTYDDFKKIVTALDGENSRRVFYAQGGFILVAFLEGRTIWANPHKMETDFNGPPTTLMDDFPFAQTISFRPLFWLSTEDTGLTGGPASW
jgi:hypothetical protein